jgi:hypothetical protein
MDLRCGTSMDVDSVVANLKGIVRTISTSEDIAHVTVSNDDTVILDEAGDKKPIEERAEQIRSAVEQDTSDYDKEKLQKQLVKLSGGDAVLKIGRASEAEAGEKKKSNRCTECYQECCENHYVLWDSINCNIIGLGASRISRRGECHVLCHPGRGPLPCRGLDWNIRKEEGIRDGIKQIFRKQATLCFFLKLLLCSFRNPFSLLQVHVIQLLNI